MDRIDALTAQLDKLVKNIDAALDAEMVRKRRQTFHLTHDDGVDDNGNNYDDVSNPSASAADESDGDGGDDGYDESDYDDEDIALGKYQREEAGGHQQSNDSTHRPGSLDTSSHTSSSNQRHTFESLVSAIVNDKGLPRSQAMALARMQDPAAYLRYQGHHTAKAAPTSFEGLVEQEMLRKGVTWEVGAQRVMQAHGSAALQNRSMSKREAVAVVAKNQLVKAAADIWEDNAGLDRCEALREARKAHPRLFKAMR
jgi:hypothetical protein